MILLTCASGKASCPADDDDVGLHVFGCRVDILGTNCKKFLKVKMRGWGITSTSVRVIMSGRQQGEYCWIKKTFCRWECILLRIKNDDHLDMQDGDI